MYGQLLTKNLKMTSFLTLAIFMSACNQSSLTKEQNVATANKVADTTNSMVAPSNPAVVVTPAPSASVSAGSVASLTNSQSGAVSGWSTIAKYGRNSFEEYFVNEATNGARMYSQCAQANPEGLVCAASGVNCQVGNRPTAKVFLCNKNYEVHGTVKDIDTGLPIAGAKIIFHTGGPVNVWDGISITSDANGDFNFTTGTQPALAIATRAGFTNAFNAGDVMARAATINGYLTVIPMKKQLIP